MSDSTQSSIADALLPGFVPAQLDPVLTALPLSEFAPVTAIRRPLTELHGPAVPAVDVHNHLGRWITPDGSWVITDVPAFVDMMDRCGLASMVNLDGRWGTELDENIARYDTAYPGRFATFAHFDFARLQGDRPTETMIADLHRAVDQGARGIKVWKYLGLGATDAAGNRVLPDDERLTDVFSAAGDLGLPVLIHVADPIAFFRPLDRHNERLDELRWMPSWWFGGDGNPTFDRLVDALATLVRRSPQTTFIGAHGGCAAEDLDWVSALMTECPNFHIDISARLAELGRQPRRFRHLVQQHPDRVLFGTDTMPQKGDSPQRPQPEPVLPAYWRFLETDDECFPYAPWKEIPPQGRWEISGAALPPDLLRAVYADNARRLIRF